MQLKALGLKRDRADEENGELTLSYMGKTAPVITMRPTQEYFYSPWRVPDSILYAPFRTKEELKQIRRGVIGEDPRPR